MDFLVFFFPFYRFIHSLEKSFHLSSQLLTPSMATPLGCEEWKYHGPATMPLVSQSTAVRPWPRWRQGTDHMSHPTKVWNIPWNMKSWLDNKKRDFRFDFILSRNVPQKPPSFFSLLTYLALEIETSTSIEKVYDLALYGPFMKPTIPKKILGMASIWHSHLLSL